MISKSAPKYRDFKNLIRHDTQAVHVRAIPYSDDEDNTALMLSVIGLSLVVAITVSFLVAFSVL